MVKRETETLTQIMKALGLDINMSVSEDNLTNRPRTCAGMNCGVKHHCVLYLNGLASGECDFSGQLGLDHPVGNIPQDCIFYEDAYPEDLED